MNTQDFKLSHYYYLDDKGRSVIISKESMSIMITMRSSGDSTSHHIDAMLVEHPDRLTWKAEKGDKLSPMDKMILSNVLATFQDDPKYRKECEQKALKELDKKIAIKQAELNDLLKAQYKLLN